MIVTQIDGTDDSAVGWPSIAEAAARLREKSKQDDSLAQASALNVVRYFQRPRRDSTQPD
jgi:hypothetical protein